MGVSPRRKNDDEHDENEKENEDEWEHHDDRIRDTEFLIGGQFERLPDGERPWKL